MSAVQKFGTVLSNFRRIIKQNGGVIGSVLKIYRMDELKDGTLIGEDKYGNKYYENKRYMLGRSRWIDFSDNVGMDYDGSQIPSDWHRWMHYITDDPPNKVEPIQRPFMIDHQENLSGSNDQYVPYSTTRPKIQAWQPPTVNK